ncbi:MAG TPA: TonB-dependent receptor plug domain-containing protein, partial [Chthoniobacterales bacterium]|nr:TonB-dependent receptor plug domain-containing protein [Chthoniobacterales bacterium]
MSQLLAVALTASSIINSRAQDTVTETSEIVVSATRIETPIDQVGSSISVVTDEEFERRQERSVPKVLRTVPGLNIVRSGGPGGKTSVLMRGTNSTHTALIIDGTDANDPSQDGVFDFGQVLTVDLARIEVLRGAQSSLYRSDALGALSTKLGVDLSDTVSLDAVAQYVDSTLFFTNDDYSVVPSTPAAKRMRQALIPMATIWPGNQAIGFSLFHFPRPLNTMLWGVVLGAAALLTVRICLHVKLMWKAAFCLLTVAVLRTALAQDAVSSPTADAETEGITVVGRVDDLTGVATTASQGAVGAADLKQRPILRRGELLEVVPGLVITQHSGEAKANQYYLRGFNLDHGTDFSV